MKSPLPLPPKVIAQVAALADLSWSELKALYLELHGCETPVAHRRFVERRLAYRLQENAYREVNPGLLERNAQRIKELVQSSPLKRKRIGVVPIAGTVLTRHYDGAEHRVTVLTDGHFEYGGRRYANLSVIAREITGTRWSGPAFFGLRKGGQ